MYMTIQSPTWRIRTHYSAAVTSSLAALSSHLGDVSGQWHLTSYIIKSALVKGQADTDNLKDVSDVSNVQSSLRTTALQHILTQHVGWACSNAPDPHALRLINCLNMRLKWTALWLCLEKQRSHERKSWSETQCLWLGNTIQHELRELSTR